MMKQKPEIVKPLGLLCFFLCVLLVINGCKQQQKDKRQKTSTDASISDTIIIDCNYTFAEAVAGSKVPKHIIEQLELFSVKYYSMDGKIHQGQIITNHKIAKDISELFEYMFEVKFPVFQAVPIVRYNWKDDLSMAANNTYSFCYRNASYSKHAQGLAIDINPMQNPLRWKEGYRYRKDKPENAEYNPKAPGTLTSDHPVVLKFKSKGFKWGHEFRRNYDTHHFEKK